MSIRVMPLVAIFGRPFGRTHRPPNGTTRAPPFRGLPPNPAADGLRAMALYGSLATLRSQAPQTNGFATAFRYVEELLRDGSPLQERLRAIASGDAQKTELGGGVFVIEQAYETKLRADGFFESHRKYADVQVVFEGEEAMEVADIARMTLRQPYNPERDLIVYEDNTDASILRVFAGQIAIFYPNDVHMPTLRIRAEPVAVRKAVVKVPVAD